MSKRSELWRYFANYLNIVAGGRLTAACAAAPIAYMSSDRVSDGELADAIVLLLMASLLFHGIGQVALFTLVDQ